MYTYIYIYIYTHTKSGLATEVPFAVELASCRKDLACRGSPEIMMIIIIIIIII